MKYAYYALIEEFLKEYPDGTTKQYRFKLLAFHQFLEQRKHLDENNYFYIMSKLTQNDLISSIDYYIKNYKVKYMLTVDGYFGAITSYNTYLHSKKDIENEIFSNKLKYSELKKLVSETILRHKLNTKQKYEPLSDDKIKELIAKCNEYLNDSDIYNVLAFAKNPKYNSKLSLYMSAIIIKIIIFAGTKNDTLLDLTIDDIDTDLNKIRLNGYWVHMPDSLALQMKHYLNARKEIVQDSGNKLLFFSIEDTSNKTTNGQMLKFMRELLGHSRAMCIAKNTIIRMLEVGIPADIIMDFTGYADDVFGHCLEIYNNQKELLTEKILDARLHETRYFENL